jgi:hypothetical protein
LEEEATFELVFEVGAGLILESAFEVEALFVLAL